MVCAIKIYDFMKLSQLNLPINIANVKKDTIVLKQMSFS